MAKITDLIEADNKPATIQEWVDRHSPEEREILNHALRHNSPSQVWRVLSNLDEGFPFKRSGLETYMRRLKA